MQTRGICYNKNIEKEGRVLPSVYLVGRNRSLRQFPALASARL